MLFLGLFPKFALFLDFIAEVLNLPFHVLQDDFLFFAHSDLLLVFGFLIPEGVFNDFPESSYFVLNFFIGFLSVLFICFGQKFFFLAFLLHFGDLLGEFFDGLFLVLGLLQGLS